MALSLRSDFLIGGMSSFASTGAGFTVSTFGAATAAEGVFLLRLAVLFLAVVRFAAFRTGFFLACASTVVAVKAITVSNKHNFMIRFFICSLFLNIVIT
jgi:hypothetical protein